MRICALGLGKIIYIHNIDFLENTNLVRYTEEITTGQYMFSYMGHFSLHEYELKTLD